LLAELNAGRQARNAMKLSLPIYKPIQMKRSILLSMLVLCAVWNVCAQYDDKVRLELTAISTPLAAVDTSCGAWNTSDKIKINGRTCDVMCENGNCFVEVAKAADGKYTAVYPADCAFIHLDADKHIILPPSQKYSDNHRSEKIYMPTYGAAASGKLQMKNICGVLKLTLRGSADINTVKIEDNAGGYVSGYFNYDEASGKVVCRNSTAAGVYCVVLDCSNDGRGVRLDGKGRNFYVVLPARNYVEGFRITVSDRSHRSMICNIPKAVDVSIDRIASLPVIDYRPADDQIFSEHFDAFVYGGNRVFGKQFKGYGPATKQMPVDNKFDGTERPVHLYEYNKAGSVYIQDKFGVSLDENRLVTRRYLDNRNIGDWLQLFRVQEYQGYVGVGVADNSRGIIETPRLDLDGICDIEVSFKVCPQAAATSSVQFLVDRAGVISEYYVNGVRRGLSNFNYPYTGSERETLRLKNGGAIAVAREEAEKKAWSDVRVVVSGATCETTLKWMSEHFESRYVNGFFIDDIEVKLLRSVPREKILRVMDYNVQNGMWADQQNNYDNFVEYVRSVDPDICIFCEAQSIYYAGTHDKCKIEERYLPYKYKPYTQGIDPNFEPEGWQELAARWGHGYAVIGAHQDNHPVVITSRYPITLVQKLGGEKIWHGGLHAQITVGGEKINLVGFHPWPFGWYRDVPAGEERRKSIAEFGGDRYRLFEMKYFIDNTILDPAYADEKNWLIMGDTNCASPLDDGLYEHGPESMRYAGNRYILDNTPCRDIVKTYYCNDRRDVVPYSTQSSGRIDIMYGSPSMMNRVIKAKSPRYGFTAATYDKKNRFYDTSSDHLPVIVDFEWR